MNNEIICFACLTEFHLFVSYILSTTIYYQKKKILLICKNFRLAKYIDSLLELNIWDELIIIDPFDPLEEIISRLIKLSDSIDILHFFSWGFSPYNKLFVQCISKDKKVILTDEGSASYLPFKWFNSWIDNYDSNRSIVGEVDLKKASEIWLFNPLLFRDQKIIPIRKIDLVNFYKSCNENFHVVEDFKKIFKFDENKLFNYDLIYFRQYYSLRGDLTINADSFIDNQICSILESNNFYIKDHPAYLINPFKQKNDSLFTLDIPWEAFIVLSKIDNSKKINMPKVYISSSSSAMFNTNAFGIFGEFIFLNHIFELYTDIKDNNINELIIASKQIYPNSKFYEPKDWDELQKIISNIAKENKLYQPKVSILQLYKEECKWLREQYLNQRRKN